MRTIIKGLILKLTKFQQFSKLMKVATPKSFFTFFMIPLTIYVNSLLMVLFEDDGRRSCRRNP